MEIDEVKESLDQSEPPSELPALVKALWHDANGDWDRAHDMAQDEGGPDGAWVHAYLHRKEGDIGNASYWYNRAGKEMPEYSLDEEWSNITEALLEKYA